MGPLKQLKRMFEPTRLIATIVMLVNTVFCYFGFCVNTLLYLLSPALKGL